MASPATVRKLSLAAALLAVGLLAAGRIDPLDAAAVCAFVVGAVGATSIDRAAAVIPVALVPAVLLLVVLVLGGFGNLSGAVALVGCAVTAGAVAATV